MSKKKPYQFSTTNKTELRLLNICKNSERLISREQFLQLGNKHILDNWRKAGYIEKADIGKEPFLRLTNGFYNAYKSQVDADIQTAGSGSPGHAGGVITALSLLPDNMRARNGAGEANILNGQEVKDYIKDLRAHTSSRVELENKEAQIRQEWRDQYNKAYDAYIKAQISGNAIRIKESYVKMCAARNLAERADNPRVSVFSTPDLQVRFTPLQLQQYADNLREHAKHEHCRQNIERYENAAKRIETIATTTKEPQITVAIEIISSHYQSDDIAVHMAYEAATDIPVILVPS